MLLALRAAGGTSVAPAKRVRKVSGAAVAEGHWHRHPACIGPTGPKRDQDRGRIARPVRRGAASQAGRRCHFRQRGTSVWVAWRHVYLATVGFEWRSSTSQVLAVEAAPAVA